MSVTTTSSSRRTLAAAGLLAALMLVSIAQAQPAYRWVDKNGRVNYGDRPPSPTETRDMQVRKLHGNVVDTGGAYGYEADKAARSAPLTLYTSAGCGEHCRAAREFLVRRGAPYREKVVETADDADAYRKATGSEQLQVPVLMAGQRVEIGYSEVGWQRLLDNAGYPAEGATTRKPSVKAEAAAAAASVAPPPTANAVAR